MAHPHQQRKRLKGVILAALFPFVRGLVFLIPKARPGFSGVTVFQAYQVGDLFMALPALTRLRAVTPVQVIVRTDCLPLVQALGFAAVGYEHAWFHEPSLGRIWQGLRGALTLRGQLGRVALDTNADPRSALALRIMGVTQVISYQRSYAAFFTQRFKLPENPWHQAEKDLAVVEGFLGAGGLAQRLGRAARPAVAGAISNHPLEKAQKENWPEILLGCWTRKDTKNWSLDKWDGVLTELLRRGFRIGFIDPPDGDASWKAFALKWETQVLRVTEPLLSIFQALQPEGPVKAVITLDNFLGHMAAYAGRPVLWVNGSSDAKMVKPKAQGAGFTQEVSVLPMPCRPCQHRCVNPRYKACFEDLSVDQMKRALGQFLRDCGLSQEI